MSGYITFHNSFHDVIKDNNLQEKLSHETSTAVLQRNSIDAKKSRILFDFKIRSPLLDLNVLFSFLRTPCRLHPNSKTNS